MDPVMLNTTTEKPATSASIDPTERSISPVRHTMPMPMAMVPITALWRSTFMVALSVRPPFAMAYTTKMARNTSTKLYFLTSASTFERLGVLEAVLLLTLHAPHSFVSTVWSISWEFVE